MNESPNEKQLAETTELKWYSGITRYQWLVLLIASLGWIFDVFEGQIFVASMNEALNSLASDVSRSDRILYNNIAFVAFLLGGALGGVVFGALSDKIGRTKTMIITILVYSLFTCITAFAQNWWQMTIMRFLVAMGVGGEWAVASAMVAEVFPARARSRMAAIFHGSSVFGTYLAILVGAVVVGNESLGANGWRWGFAIGAVPALLTLWIRVSLREPEQWVKAQKRAETDVTQATGRILDLFDSRYVRGTIVGLTLSSVGLATFWGIHIYGKNFLLNNAQQRILALENVSPDAETEVVDAALAKHRSEIKNQEMLGMFLTTTGGGVGLLAFGPICEWMGRRGAFALYHLGGFAIALSMFMFLTDASDQVYYVMLPIFGFLTLGMHAGYAVYFPELYPTRLRGTGGGFCFNMGRIAAAAFLGLIGLLSSQLELSQFDSASWLCVLFLVGAAVLIIAPETKGRELD